MAVDKLLEEALSLVDNRLKQGLIEKRYLADPVELVGL